MLEIINKNKLQLFIHSPSMYFHVKKSLQVVYIGYVNNLKAKSTVYTYQSKYKTIVYKTNFK